MKRRVSSASLANLEAGRRKPNRSRYSYAVLARMTHRMMAAKFTVRQLATNAGVSWGSASRWTQAMWDAGNVHVVEYLRSANNRVTSRVYEWGKRDSVPKPAAIPRAEYFRQYRQRRQTLDGAWRMPARRQQEAA